MSIEVNEYNDKITKFRLEIVRDGLFIKWQSQLNDNDPFKHEDMRQSILLTGCGYEFADFLINKITENHDTPT